MAVNVSVSLVRFIPYPTNMSGRVIWYNIGKKDGGVIMEYITRERFEKIVKNKHRIDLEELVMVIESEFGYSVKLEEKDKNTFTELQRRSMTDIIFKNENVLKQLHDSSFESDDDYIEDEEAFMKLIHVDRDNG